MSGNAKKARKQAAKQAADARKVTQMANEEGARTRQQAERGSAGKNSRGGRALLMGMLSDRLQTKMGGGE